jgi:hypothetical protein
MNTLNIYCDGGFGNRYGTLLGGLAVASYHEMHPVVVWRDTSACRLPFNEIFSSDVDVVDRPLHDFSKSVLLMHEDFIQGVKNYNVNSFRSIEDLPVTECGSYVYNNNWIPEWMDEHLIIQEGRQLKFIDKIKNFCDQYCEEHSISSFTIGVHLRATDFNTFIPKFDKEYKWIESQPYQNFFVLSDDKSTEQKFNKLDNVIVREKDHYVEKVNENSSWCGNVERTKESVIDSLIDLTILSRTNIIINSPSSFLKTSLLLKKING